MNTNENSPNNKKQFHPLSFAGGMIVVALIVFLIYFFFPKHNNNLVLEKNSPAEKDTSIFIGEHFYRIHHHKHIDNDAEALVLMPNEEKMLEKGNLTDKQRRLIELLPNAPCIYLYDLKVTEYKKLYYQIDGNALTISDTSVPALINQAMKNFKTLHFDVTITKLNSLLRINQEDPNALFYLGASYFYEKNYIQALIMLNRVGNLANNAFKQDAYWYKALCFIDMQKTNEAKTLLTHIVDAQGFYAEQAKQKLASLK